MVMKQVSILEAVKLMRLVMESSIRSWKDAWLGGAPLCIRYNKLYHLENNKDSYTSDGLSLIATKIGTPMMLDSYTNSMCLESWGRSSHARVLIEIDACNDFNDNLVMVVPNL
ncbi:hypothetical protein Tco_1470522 [Tanacetum coccineum]